MSNKPVSETSNQNEPSAQNEDVRIGVYTCYCGGNISDVVDCEKVAKELKNSPNVVVSRTNMSMCSDAGQSIIEEDIKKHGINRVVIGACAPSLHEQTFRGTVTRAGLNPYLYHHVGIREQDSWVHKHASEEATEKAVHLMSAGVAKSRLLDPLDPIRLEAEKHALVIGGGVAGLRSALDIARRGIRVTLIEKSPFLGGRMAQLEKVFPSGANARQELHKLLDQVVNHPKVRIFTLAELVDVSGYIGDYQVKIQQQSRGITEENAEIVMAKLSPQVPDEFNYGLTKRKVVYKPYEGCYPSVPAVDWENYDGAPIPLNGKAITLENHPKQIDLTVGAIVIATGYDPYVPQNGEYGYGEIPEVVTLPQFIRQMAVSEKGKQLQFNGHPIRDIVLLHCVGSRQIDGIHKPQPDGQVNDYCSRVCCTTTLHLANELKQRYPDVNLYDLYEDIRTYGRGHEAYYQQASEEMVRFLRFSGEDLPEVIQTENGDTHPVVVKIKDRLTWGEEIEVPADLVILAVGMMPRPVDDLIQLLKVSPGKDRFLLEVHPKLRPVETAVPGVVLAGTAQGPMNVQESVAAASAAAAKVAGLLSQGKVELEPFVAKVDLEKCDGSGECVKVCHYEDAISVQPVTINGLEVQRAVISPANCAGCGNCVSACPNLALDIQGWTLKQYEAMVDALAMDLPEYMEVAA
jgi:heterodisulfide reductase subunit A